MASSTPEDKLKYILTVLKHCDLPKPDYHAIAAETGVNNANIAQKKYKAIIQTAGFELDTKNNQITGGDGVTESSDGVGAVSKTKKGVAKAKKSVPQAKRKASKAGSSGDDDGDSEEGSVKRMKVSKGRDEEEV